MLGDFPEAVLRSHLLLFADLIQLCGCPAPNNKLEEKIRKAVKTLLAGETEEKTLLTVLSFLDHSAFPLFTLWTNVLQKISLFALKMANENLPKAVAFLTETYLLSAKYDYPLTALQKDPTRLQEWILFEGARDALQFALYALQPNPKKTQVIIKRLSTLSNPQDPLNALYPKNPPCAARLARALENLHNAPFRSPFTELLLTEIYIFRKSLSDDLSSVKSRAKFDPVIAKMLLASGKMEEFTEGLRLLVEVLISTNRPQDLSEEFLSTLLSFFDKALLSGEKLTSLAELISKATDYYKQHLLTRIDPLRWIPILLHFPDEALMAQAYALALVRLQAPPSSELSLQIPPSEIGQSYQQLIERLLLRDTSESLGRANTLLTHPGVCREIDPEEIKSYTMSLHTQMHIQYFTEKGPLESLAAELWALLLKIQLDFFVESQEHRGAVKENEWFSFVSGRLKVPSSLPLGSCTPPASTSSPLSMPHTPTQANNLSANFSGGSKPILTRLKRP